MSSAPIIYWFRQDLRLHDLPGLCAAAATGQPVLPVYLLDDDAAGERAPGAASRWWLHGSLAALAAEISETGGRLYLRRGDTLALLEELCKRTGASAVYCSRQYEPWAVALEERLHEALGAKGVTVRRYPGTLLFEPGSVLTQSGEPYKVFTPFWRACRKATPPKAPLERPASVNWQAPPDDGDNLKDWQLRPRQPDWAANWGDYWEPGSAGAHRRLQRFLEEAVDCYADDRDRPDRDGTSRLSPHLHAGDISPRTVWDAAQRVARGHGAAAKAVDKFLAELGWREFSYQLLSFFPTLGEKNFKADFDAFPWADDPEGLAAWQRGRTGYPLVDAGLRELWATGYMHNRVRMVAASFLTKHLRVHWREGEAWFWDTLVDADMANNCAGWQWVAGSGADAAPYFRIFNPVAQGEKFDPDGAYVRHWVPELAQLPDKYLNKPWEAPASVLRDAGVELDKDYPAPIVEHKAARQAALDAYGEITGKK